jgi:uracil-DNA glycosylase family 4
MQKKLYKDLGMKEVFNANPVTRIAFKKEHKQTELDLCNSLEDLRKLVENFDGCELKKSAQNTVFADGNPSSQIMFIGEAPGANEDEQGIPFCGQSGKLLDNIIAAIGLTREKNAYITNTVFWRPPANRKPTNEEIAMCRPFVKKHIALIKPKLIILVGSTAVESLLEIDTPITKLRGTYFDYTNEFLGGKTIRTTAIFHPSYLLRQPAHKKTMWFDILKIKYDCQIDSDGKVMSA